MDGAIFYAAMFGVVVFYACISAIALMAAGAAVHMIYQWITARLSPRN